MFLLDVGEECGVAEVALAAGTDEVAGFVGVVVCQHGNIIGFLLIVNILIIICSIIKEP